MSKIKLIQGDCLIKMKDIPDKSVNAIICDLPFGITAPKWDSVLDISKVWEQYNRIITDVGVIALFSAQPFTTNLIHSNINSFRYCWYWIKNQGTNFFHAKRMPIRKVEEICIFEGRTYYPQHTSGHTPTNSAKGCSNGKAYHGTNKRNYQGGSTTRYPINTLYFNCVNNYERLHSSEKPVALLEYLVKTYTLEGETVLDNCMDSGSTGVACKNLNRDFIGIEMNEDYFKIAEKRINENIMKFEKDITHEKNKFSSN